MPTTLPKRPILTRRTRLPGGIPSGTGVPPVNHSRDARVTSRRPRRLIAPSVGGVSDGDPSTHRTIAENIADRVASSSLHRRGKPAADTRRRTKSRP